MQKITHLRNGLKVVLLQDLHAESVTVNITGKAGSMYEQENEIGVAHFLEHIVFDGSVNYPNEQALSEIIENVGGIREGTTRKETVEYWVQILPRFVDRAVLYLSEIVLNPLFKEHIVEKHKKIIEQEINRFKSDPEKYIVRLSYQSAFPDHRLGGLNTGDTEDIKKVTPEKLQAFHERRYHTGNFIIVVCGNFDEAAILSLLEKYFSPMKAGSQSEHVSIAHVPEPTIVVSNNSVTDQVSLQLQFYAYPLTDKRNYIASYIAAILGRGKLSRLRKRLRDEHGLTYSMWVINYAGQAFGLLSTYAALSQENMPQFFSILKEEFTKLQHEPISQEEHERALALMESSVLFNFEDPVEKSIYYARVNLESESLKDHTEIHSVLKNTTAKDIQDCARELFSQSLKITAIGKNVTRDMFSDF